MHCIKPCKRIAKGNCGSDNCHGRRGDFSCSGGLCNIYKRICHYALLSYCSLLDHCGGGGGLTLPPGGGPTTGWGGLSAHHNKHRTPRSRPCLPIHRRNCVLSSFKASSIIASDASYG